MNELADKQGVDGGLRDLALFAGIGGGILGGHLLGWRTICAVERDAYAAQVLAQRQNDGVLPPFPIWSDVCSFDGKPWRGIVEVISGGFPCQDISAAGNGSGISGSRSGLWGEMARIIGEVRPKFVFVENSPLLVGRGLAVVLGDLAEMGYDAQWCIISASDTGAPHKRDRIWIVANDNGARQPQPAGQQQECGLGAEQRGEALADADSIGRDRRSRQSRPKRRTQPQDSSVSILADTMREREQRIVAGESDPKIREEPSERQDRPRGHGFGRWPAEPGVGRVVDGLAYRMDRIKALGNGQVPRVAAAAFNILTT